MIDRKINEILVRAQWQGLGGDLTPDCIRRLIEAAYEQGQEDQVAAAPIENGGVMSKKPDGGPAFPCLDDCEYDSGHSLYLSAEGMSLRDWFAGQALSGYLADPNAKFDLAPRDCYAIADAMLAEREKGGSA